MKLNRPSAYMAEKLQMEIWDDFSEYIDAQRWTKSIGAGASAAITANTANGVLNLTTGATQNIQALIAGTNANFKLLKGQPIYGECQLQYAETSTNNAGVAFGFSSVVTSVMLQDTTGIPATNFTGLLIYKQAGDTVWRTISSNGTTQTLSTAAQSSQPTPTTLYQQLQIEARDVDGTNFEVTYFLNDAPLMYTAAPHRPIKDTIAIASASAMKLVVFAKNPGGASSEVISVDYVFGVQRRFSQTGA